MAVLPRLLDEGTIELDTYPLTMVVAEGLVTTLERGTANTRFRAVAIVPFSDALAGYTPLAQRKWAVRRREVQRDGRW